MKTREQIHNEVAQKVAQWKTTAEANLFDGTSTKTQQMARDKKPQPNYKAEFQRELNIFLSKYPKYNTPGWRTYLTDLAKRESSFNRTNGNGRYLGWFALDMLSPYWNGYKAQDQFLNMIRYTENNLKTINNTLTPAQQKQFQRMGITQWGLLGGAHLGGPNALKAYLNGKDRYDGNTYVSDYIIEMNQQPSTIKRNINSKRTTKYKMTYEDRPSTDFNTPYITQDTNNIINQDLAQFYQNQQEQEQQSITPSYIDTLNQQIEEANQIWSKLNNPEQEEVAQILSLEEELQKIQEQKDKEFQQQAYNQAILEQLYTNPSQTNITTSRTEIQQPQEEISYASNPDEYYKALEQRYYGNTLKQGGNLFSGEEPHTQSLDKVLYDTYNAEELPEVNILGIHRPATLLYDKNTGEYSRQSTGDILTPINTSISNNPADWSYQDQNGTLFTPARNYNSGEITQGRERNNLDRILSWSNQHYNNPIMGAAARWNESWHNDRNPIKAGLNYFDSTGLIGYGIDKGIDLYNQGTDALGGEDAAMAVIAGLPLIGKGMQKAKKFTSLLDWSPENYFGNIGRHNRTRVNGTYIEPDAEDIRTLQSLVPEYEQIEEQAVRNGDFIIGKNDNYIVADEPSMSPYEWILRHSKNGQQYRQEHAYTGVSNVHKDSFLENSKDTNAWTTRTKPEDVAEYASTPLGGEAPYTAEYKAYRIRKYQSDLNEYQKYIEQAKNTNQDYIIDRFGNKRPLSWAESKINDIQFMLNHEIKEPVLHGGSVYDITIPTDVPTHYWGDAKGAKWGMLPFGETQRFSIENEMRSELTNLNNYLASLESNTTMPKETLEAVKTQVEAKAKELETRLANKDYYYEKPGVVSTDAAVAKDTENRIGNTMINNVMDTYNGTMLDESIYHAGVPKKVWLGNNGAMNRNSSSPLKSLLLPIGITSSIGLPLFLNSNNEQSLGGTLNKGDILDVSEKQMQELLKQGYKIELQ